MCFLFKIIGNIISVFLLFFVLDSLLYIKAYSEIMIMDSYIKYEVISGNIINFNSDKYEVVFKSNGSYTIILNRESLFVFEKYKKIKYDGIVD